MKTYMPPHIKRRIERERLKRKQIDNIVDGSGPFGLLAIQLLDYIIDIVFELAYKLSDIFRAGVNVVEDTTIGQYKGLFGQGSKIKNSTYISLKYFRYIITILTPPLGVFLSKGFKGWFSVVLCLILCYFNYIIGIIYGLILVSNSKYADRYEKREIEKFNKK